MSNPNELVLCVPTEVFGPLDGYESLKRLSFNAGQTNPRFKRLQEWFQKNSPLWKRRGLVETNEKFLQLIPYVIVTFGNGDLFSYQRSKAKGSGSERRLLGKSSLGVGGHINPCDVKPHSSIESVSLWDKTKDPFRAMLYTAALREMHEELKPNRDLSLRNLIARGFMRTHEAPVAKVHAAVVFEYHYRGQAKFPIFNPAPEISNGVFSAVSYVRQHARHFEQWSQEILPILRQDFNIA